MESVEFCGMACHSVMQPEHTAYQRSSHSRVSCAECHIGPGADWFVKSKLDGAWQLVAVAFDLYPRPIPTPLHDLRPARETCEQCHWPTRFVGDKLVIKKHYEEDEANTELTIRAAAEGRWHGRKWRFRNTLARRSTASTFATGRTRHARTFTKSSTRTSRAAIKLFADRKAPEEGGVWREMDCVDCHNRPSHNYQAAGYGNRRCNARWPDRSDAALRTKGRSANHRCRVSVARRGARDDLCRTDEVLR